MTIAGGSMANEDGVRKETLMMHGGRGMGFFWGNEAIVLYPGWPGENVGMYALALVFIFLLSAAVEVLSVPPATKPHAEPAVEALAQAGVYAVRTALAYLVVLAIMSFNLGVFFVALAGHTLGFFIIKRRVLAMASSQSEPAPSTNDGVLLWLASSRDIQGWKFNRSR
ncbi:copper transporter 6-like [Malania oleifera]|uniref:copper transporter 6-like n=1 Tax=Malania oleifera TaxID=397392 RepID=UPI0025AEC783|nr:copper transporter 6-like [Malania oleifera]